MRISSTLHFAIAITVPAAACLIAAAIPAIAATPIAVQNGLFKTPPSASSQIPSWTDSKNKGNFGIYTDTEKYPAGKGVPAGSKIAYVGIDPSNNIEQNLHVRYVTGHKYTLTAYAGESNGQKADQAVFGFYNATKLPAKTAPNETNDVYHGSFSTKVPGYTIMQVSFTASKAINGDEIGIYFEDKGHGTETVHIADVTVSVSP